LVFGEVVVNPDLFATRLLLPLALTIGAYFTMRSGLGKAMMLGISGVLIFAIVITQSRAALLAVLVLAIVFLLRLGMSRGIIAVSVAFGIAVVLAGGHLSARMGEALSTGGAGRLDIWYVGWELLKHYGIFGAGLANFPQVYSSYAGVAPVFRGFARASHNIFLQISVEGGLVGVCLLIQALRVQLRAGRDSLKPGVKPNIWLVACEATGWAVVTSSFFADLTWEKIFWLTWIMLALAAQLRAKPFQQPEGKRSLAVSQ
jgi:O-antigen ligase